jgi:4-aminobutyrate aminotransferase/(S)-3-amino-2-methylpropionate transaminase
MRAIEFVTDKASKTPDADTAQKVLDKAREDGLLVIKCGVHRNIVRFLAPLVTSDADLAAALDILEGALKATTR